MLRKLNDLLAGLPMTVVSGIFLLLDLVPHLTGSDSHSVLPFDPAWVSVIISGIPLLYLAIWRVIHNPGISKISSALLICIAMFAAIAIGDLFAAGEVVFIMAIGALLEDATANRAKKGLRKLINLAPTTGRRKKDGKEEMINAEDIRIGDILRILPGETIPVDGRIIKGDTSVDQAIMTGESLPVDKTEGDEVFCGTVNRFGSIISKRRKSEKTARCRSSYDWLRKRITNKPPCSVSLTNVQAILSLSPFLSLSSLILQPETLSHQSRFWL